MKDYLGQSLVKGDFVIIENPYCDGIVHGKITKITRKRYIEVSWTDGTDGDADTFKVELLGRAMMKLEGPAFTAFLLTRG